MSRPLTQSAKATVTMQIEISVPSNWGPDCSIKQIHEQAEADARGMIRNLSPQTADNFVKAIRIMGEPQIKTIIVSTERL